jgi:hypothetical protein
MEKEIAALVAKAWELYAQAVEDRSKLGEAHYAYEEAERVARLYSTEFDREHPARRGIKAPSPQHKAWSAEKDRRKGIASGVLAILDPVRKRALAYARGRGEQYDREREKHETFRTRLASRLASEIDRRESRIGGPLPAEAARAFERIMVRR